MRWIKGSADNGCWAGTYERAIQKAFVSHIKPGFLVYDIGANVGFYSLLSSRLAGASGRVIAFEPLPENLTHLRRHIRINNRKNIEVREAAISSTPGVARFAVGASTGFGKLEPTGTMTVDTLTLDSLPPPDFIKMDIEGAELDALQGGATMLAKHRPIIVLATHSYDLQESCRSLLKSLGYTVDEITGPGADTGAQRDFLCMKAG